MKYLIADVSKDGSKTNYWGGPVTADDPSDALKQHVEGCMERGGSTHASRLTQEGTVRFAVGKQSDRSLTTDVNVTSIRFYDVTLGGVTVTPVSA